MSTQPSGARQVFAVDSFDNKCFRLARELLGFSEGDIQYRPNIQISSLHRHFEPKTFDVIVCAGIIYHMLFPMQAFTETRKLITDGGYLIIETPFDATSTQPTLTFNANGFIQEPSSYFIPTETALIGMANLAGFELVATRTLSSPTRITLLLRASTRRDLIADDNVAPYIKQMLKRDLCDDVFRFRDLERIPAKQAKVPLKNLNRCRTIVARSEVVQWPHHSNNDKPSYGNTRYETPDGNTLKL